MDNLIVLALTLLLPFIWAHTEQTTQSASMSAPVQEQFSPSAASSPDALCTLTTTPNSIFTSNTTNLSEETSILASMQDALHQDLTSLHAHTQSLANKITQHEEKLDLLLTLQQNKFSSAETHHSLFSHFTQHNYTTIAACGIAWYLYQWTRIWQHTKKLQANNNWSSWQQQATAQELQTHKQEELTAKLLLSIAHIYTNPQYPNDFVHPLLEFTADIQQEIDTTKKLLRLYKKLTRWHLNRLFFIDQSAITLLQTQLEKLTFIYNLFSIWHMQTDTPLV